MGMKPSYQDEVEANYNVTELSNGFTVLTESQTFPGAVNMGKYCVAKLVSVSVALAQGRTWPAPPLILSNLIIIVAAMNAPINFTFFRLPHWSRI